MLPEFISRAAVRAVDQRAIEEFGVPGVVLMENAGRGAAEWIRSHVQHGPVRICCGRGNNGGDGFVIARHLDNWGIGTQVLLFSDPADYTGDARTNLNIIQHSGLPISVFRDPVPRDMLDALLNRSEWVVDALLGTGTRGQLRAPYTDVIPAINDCSARVAAIDLPSGMDCDTGKPLGDCVRAEATLTFVAPKLGFQNPAARDRTGSVHVVDIGVPRQLLDSHDWSE